MKKNYWLVDVFKFFFAVCIVAIHTGICGDTASFTQWQIKHLVFRLAVPYFFIASGFFLSSKIISVHTREEKRVIVNKYTKHMLPGFLLFGSIGLFFQGVFDCFLGKSGGYIVLNIIRHALFYPLNAMWFCSACIIAAWLLFFFESRNKMMLGTIIAGGGYICIGVLANSYYYLFDGTFLGYIIRLYLKCFVFTRNGFSVGFLLFCLSYFIARDVNGENRIKPWMAWVLFLLSYVFFIIEETHLFSRVIVVDDHSMFLSFVILIPSLFYLTIIYSNKTDSHDTYMIRKLSSGIFFLHRTVLAIIKGLELMLDLSIPKFVVFTIVVLFSGSITVFLQLIDNKFTRRCRIFIGG